jgi:predicted metalloprotease with PDZ domain
MSEPASHLFEVELHVSGLEPDHRIQLKMPVWTPGSYLVREYARHVQDFAARDEQERPLPWSKLNKNTWQVQIGEGSVLQVRYRVYAYELSVRTNHLDLTHGYFNGAALFLYLPERVQEPICLTVVPPETDWQIATSLPRLDQHGGGSSKTFLAQTYDELVDTPVEVGLHRCIDFEALGKPHQFVAWGQGNLDLARAVQDTRIIVETTAQLWGDLPYNSYLFLLHLSPDGFGGLEHRSSTTLNYGRFDFLDPDRYQRFLALVAHEFFHTWNVKRLRPKSLQTFDYEQETYLESLWFCEGATSYYENVILLRAGLISPQSFLKTLADHITRLQKIPGRQVQSLANSSFDTWIKLYRPHENSANSQISYYLKGELVCWLLDLHMRALTEGSRSFDTVLLDLWDRFGRWEIGYTDAELQAAFESAAGSSLADFFARYLYGTEELDYVAYLQPFGLTLGPRFHTLTPAPHLGLTVNSDGNKITCVEIGSPAQQAGIWAGDELLALDGFKVTAATLTDRLKSYAVDQTVSISVFQQQELKTFWVTLAAPRPDFYVLESLDPVSNAQRSLCQGWLGKDIFPAA